MTKTPSKSPAPRARAAHHVYDQAVRAALQGGDEAQARQLLDGVKRLRSEYGDLDSLINRLEAALGAER